MKKIISLLMLVSSVAVAYFAPYYLVPIEETRAKIAVIDTGVYLTKDLLPYLCKDLHYSDSRETIYDAHEHLHGTNLVHLIAQQIDSSKNCVMIIKAFPNNPTIRNIESAEAINLAIDKGAKFINLSYGGRAYSQAEYEAIKRAIDNKIYVLVAAGNDSNELKKGFNYYPACYDINSSYFRIVGNGRNRKDRHYSSNYGSVVTDWEWAEKVCAGKYSNGKPICLTGTSEATAIKTGKLAKELTK